MTKDIKRLVKSARDKRINRAYYDNYFNISDAREAGIVQDYRAKTQLDQVELCDPNRCELLHLFGVEQPARGNSYFHLKLSIVGLYLDGPLQAASNWLLANVNLLLIRDETSDTAATTVTRYTYECEQLLDYEGKRAANKHEHVNIYKVGSLSLETVVPFSLMRLLFNGLMRVETLDGATGALIGEVQHKPMRLSLSGHPTCDKFDYQYRFDVDYTSQVISSSLAEHKESDSSSCNPIESRLKSASRLLGLTLEDRFDQPLMFEGQLESFSESGGACETFYLWGAKVKKFAQANNHLRVSSTPNDRADETRECLLAWTECGQQIHLSRPASIPSLVYGFAHGSFDYASPLLESSLLVKTENKENNVNKQKDGLTQTTFAALASFQELTNEHVIKLRAFKVKEFTIEFEQGDRSNEQQVRKVIINGFRGLAVNFNLNLGEQINLAQEKLFLMNIHDSSFCFNLAQERLLGGKGNSLVQLARQVHYEKRLASANYFGAATETNYARVSVPRGLIVTSKAYESWLASDISIEGALRELDVARRVLAARSACALDPLARDYLAPAEAQTQLRQQCERTREKLINCPLPRKLSSGLNRELQKIFKAENDLKLLKFAVRSSCVGEDSLETSAAGQMKTLLNVDWTLESISRAIVDCWLSQFELEALTYKSQNGLRFNLPMAVVVQEQIACHTAGVAATCDPLTGNKCRLEITANLGLGEGVVSGKQTDTVRVTSLNNSPDADDQIHFFNHSDDFNIEKIPGGGDGGSFCLSDEQINALIDLLLKMRISSDAAFIREREVEWGITLNGLHSFEVHLLQSRPLTHLHRLTSREIQHELDSGLSCPMDLVSRANLGEVFPGALCPLYISWFSPIAACSWTMKPYEQEQSRCQYVGENLANHAQMAFSMMTYGDSAKLLLGGERAQDSEKTRAILYSMMGTTMDEFKDQCERETFERFCREKMSPLQPDIKPSLGLVCAVDLAIYPAIKFKAQRAARQCAALRENLISLEQLFQRMQKTTDQEPMELILNEQIIELYERLLTQTGYIKPVCTNHVIASFTSVAFNVICLRMLSQQASYNKENNGDKNWTDSLTSGEVMNDFTVLLRGKSSATGAGSAPLGKQTESGDISRLLEQLLECFAESNQLERMRSMSTRALYEFLTDPQNRALKCCKLYDDFMLKNGHRAWKEFCLSTHTWADAPSSIIKLLAMRLKTYTAEEAHKERARRVEQQRAQEEQLQRVLEKLNEKKFALLKWAIPRAKNATRRRERTKSLLIKLVHDYRLAFRHLGGLLCLAGLLPSADLIFQLTIEELDEVVRNCCSSSRAADSSDRTSARDHVMPRLLYKARRRQQRARLVDKVTMPRPTLPLNEMIQSFEEQTGFGQRTSDALTTTGNGAGDQVRGLISCAGCVTGRACVISSLEEADQIEQNDILITYSIDISWSVYFYSLAGIVTEVGGIVSHGAVVAREYGLPTLCTAVGACKGFKTGQMVTLDATNGVCYLRAES